MVDGCDDPGDSQTKEDVNRVAARHVTDGVVGRLLVDGSDLAGEGVRERGAQGNECDCGDLKIRRCKNIFFYQTGTLQVRGQVRGIAEASIATR